MLEEMKGIVLVALVVGLLAAPAAQAKKPPSFALWTAKWKASDDVARDKIGDGCISVFGQNDANVGACFVKGIAASIRQRQPIWERQVARIAKGQSLACRKAIHKYWLASRKGQRASLIYLDSHPHVALTQIVRDLDEEPLATLKSLTDEAKARAIRVCG
jgi:hypothetical protein